MEQIVFPKKDICNALTAESKERVYQTTECDLQLSKVYLKYTHSHVHVHVHICVFNVQASIHCTCTA